MDESTCTGGCACQRTAGERASVSRRGVLAGSVAAAAVMALGACSSSEEASGGGAETNGPAAQTPSDSATGSQAQESPSATGDAAPAGERLAGTGDFPVGGGVVVKTASGPIVVTHPTDNEFLAFSARCPHLGCPVTEVNENTILCNCHGSTFDGSTGDRLEGPAPTGLEPVRILVAGGEIFLA